MALIFDGFENVEEAKLFARAVKMNFPAHKAEWLLDLAITDEVPTPIVVVSRVENFANEDHIRFLAIAFGGRFCGT